MEDIRRLQTVDFGRPSDLLGRVRTTVTQIQAGTQHNVIPDVCTFVVDVRTNEHVTNAEVLEGITRCLQADVKARSTRLGSSGIALDHPVVQQGKGLGLTLYRAPTLSNAAVCPFPTLKIGPGDSARSHSADEFICVSEIGQAVDVYVKLLDGLVI
jgi:acetylornithine deacetylase